MGAPLTAQALEPAIAGGSDPTPPAQAPVRAVGGIVARGLSARRKWLPSYLFYDARGSHLFDRITELPEYYLTRAERSIFVAHGDAIARELGPAGARVLELGAGTASKTLVLLGALLRRHPRLVYQPADVSRSALQEAERRIERQLPEVGVEPLHATHEEALRQSTERGMGPCLVMFIGSSIGNYTRAEATALLRAIRGALGGGGVLLLGTDLRKRPDLLLPAYNDAAGVTAAFNKNLLVRLNRELGANFDPGRFRHVALWNDSASRIEMYLESLEDQIVHIEALARSYWFAARERIHTESSHKYDRAQVEALLGAAGLARRRTYTDPDRYFAVHLAQAFGSSRGL